jgi:hypothetical protein
VLFRSYGDHYELDEDEFRICVSWKNYRDNKKITIA